MMILIVIMLFPVVVVMMTTVDGGNNAFFLCDSGVGVHGEESWGGGGYYVRGEVSNLKRLLFFSFLARCMLHAQFWASESH